MTAATTTTTGLRDRTGAPVPAYALFGIAVHAVTMTQAVEVCEAAIDSRRPLTVGVVNAAKLVNLRRDPALRGAVTACDLVVADGQAVVWASRLLGAPLPERVAGIDLFTELLGEASRRAQRVFLLGAAQDVLDLVVQRVHRDYPGVVVVGAQHGWFDPSESPQVAEAVRAARPDLLFVAMTSPRKELLLDTWSQFMDVPVCHGVGGSFDVLAGRTRRAPERWQRWGLEWLYRVGQEPGRLWRRYLVTNTRFLGLVAAERLRPTPLADPAPGPSRPARPTTPPARPEADATSALRVSA